MVVSGSIGGTVLAAATNGGGGDARGIKRKEN